jgi:hypothetical protein
VVSFLDPEKRFLSCRIRTLIPKTGWTVGLITLINNPSVWQGGAVSDLRVGLQSPRLYQLLADLLNSDQLGRREGAAKLMAIRAATAWCSLMAEDFRYGPQEI